MVLTAVAGTVFRHPCFPEQKLEKLNGKEKKMATIALILAVISLALAGIAYWRSGGQQDIQELKRQLQGEMDVLRTKQKEILESTSQSIASTYDRSRQRLANTREELVKQEKAAIEGLEEQLKKARKQLEALGDKLEEYAIAAKESTLEAARSAEEAISQRIRRIQARVTLLQAKGKASRAQKAETDKDLERADRLLQEAMELLREARETLSGDPAYHQELETMKLALQEATAAVRARTEDIRQRIEKVLADTDTIINSLETDETKAAEK
jgi:DNA repair exonuclease SbcCD ATPase subunit